MKEKEVYILDSVQGLKRPVVITNVDGIMAEKIYSTHDFDLGQSLKLMKKLGLIKKVTIFGVPGKVEKKTVKQLADLIRSTLPSKSG